MLPMSTFASWWTFWFYVLYDVIWLLGLLHIMRNEFTEVSWYCKNKSCAAIWEEYVGFWNMVDWLSITMGSAIVGLAIRSMIEMSGVNEAMLSVDRKITTIVVNGTTTYEDNFDQTLLNYMTRLEAAVDYGSRLRLVLATYPMIIIFRLFKAFSAQARLAIVTETLYVTGVDLLHFALVFASIFVTLGISGLAVKSPFFVAFR